MKRGRERSDHQPQRRAVWMSEAPVLVLNAGSSSLKYQLVVPETAEVQAKGIIERIGEPGSSIADHEAAIRAMERSTCGRRCRS